MASGPKGSSFIDPRLERRIGDHGGGEEIAGVADALAARENFRALGLGVAGELLHGRQPTRIGERTHLAGLVETVADLQAGSEARETLRKALVQALVHQIARRRDADLAGVAELGAADDLDRLVEIGVLGDDDRRMAAELHGRALHVQAGERRKLLADRGRAGEADLADDGMRDEIGGNLRRIAIDEADRARREPRRRRKP